MNPILIDQSIHTQAAVAAVAAFRRLIHTQAAVAAFRRLIHTQAAVAAFRRLILLFWGFFNLHEWCIAACVPADDELSAHCSQLYFHTFVSMRV